jgi:hypothetical protein
VLHDSLLIVAGELLTELLTLFQVVAPFAL